MPTGIYTRRRCMGNYGHTTEHRERILEMWGRHISAKRIALMFGVSVRTVYRVVNGDWGNGTRKRREDVDQFCSEINL